MQDAIIRFADIDFSQKRRRFACVANRFAWEHAPQKERRRTGLHFENVTRVRRKGFATANGETVLSLLAITWRTSADPSGEVELTFAGGHTILLDLEYLDAIMGDIGPAWSTQTMPSHEN